MGYWLAAAAALSIGSSIYGGISGSKTNKKNASNARDTAEQNANMIYDQSRYNADAYMSVAGANANYLTTVADANADAVEGFADYNADIIEMVSDYNAQFNEMDARYTLDLAELDVGRTEREVYNILGKNKTYYAGAGVRTNSGSPEDVEISTMTQGDIDIAIIRRGAQIEAQRFLDTAAMTRWQGATDAATTRYQGELQGWQMRTQAGMDASMMLNNAKSMAGMTLYEGEMNAMMTRLNGESKASMYDSAAKESLYTGFTNAATSFLGYKMMSANAPPVASSIGAARTTGIPTTNVQPYFNPAVNASTYSPIVSNTKPYQTPSAKYSLLGAFN